VLREYERHFDGHLHIRAESAPARHDPGMVARSRHPYGGRRVLGGVIFVAAVRLPGVLVDDSTENAPPPYGCLDRDDHAWVVVGRVLFRL